MVRRATLLVLAEAAAHGSLDPTRSALDAFDPLLRPLVRRQVGAAIAAAAARTRQVAGDHLLRVAFLSAHPDGRFATHCIDLDDERVVALTFESLSAPFVPKRSAAPIGTFGYRVAARERSSAGALVGAPRRFWPATTAIAVLATALMTALVVTIVRVCLLA